MPRPRRTDRPSPAVDYRDVTAILVPYRRVSTREQADSGAGLAAQRTTIEKGLAMRGATATGWDCVDKGKSGKNLHREGLDQALHLVRSGQAGRTTRNQKIAGGIIVAKLDRLSRSLVDFAGLLATAEREGWNLIALDVALDLSTPAGKMMAGILAVFAQFERDVISQRTRDGLAEKRAEGVRLGRKRTASDDLLYAVVEHWTAENNYSKVARILTAAGQPTPHGKTLWYPATVHKMIHSQDGQALIRAREQDTA